MIYLYIAVGGAIGTLARFAAGAWVGPWTGTTVPWATLGVNLLGCVLLGFLMRALPAWGAPLELRALLTVGFCGAFTTFSTFGYEAAVLLQQGAHAPALAYLLGSVLLGVLGVFLGLGVAGLLA